MRRQRMTTGDLISTLSGQAPLFSLLCHAMLPAGHSGAALGRSDEAESFCQSSNQKLYMCESESSKRAD